MEKKKKILYLITQSELGGAQTYVIDLVQSFKDEFDISVGFGEQGDGGDLAKRLKENEIKYYSISHLKRNISPWQDLLAIFSIIKLVRRIKPDIIHLNSSKISILGSLAGIISKSKIIYTVHGWVFNEPLSKLKKNFYLHAEKFTAKFKNKIICVSEFDHKEALKNKIAPKEKLITIHNGIKPINLLSKEEARKKLGINDSEIIIGSIAYLYKTKGFEYLIQAIKILIDKGLNIKTIIIGEGQEREELENWIDQLYLKNKIILAGKIDNAAELLKAFDIYVSSSVKEGLSYTIIEAMTAGLPIIATRVGGSPEMINDNEEGLLVDPANPEKLAQAITKIINNKELKNKLSEMAEKKARANFTLAKMIDKTKKTYE